MCRSLALLATLWCAAALAQDDTPDAASIPDASVGQGGAAIASPDMEDTSATTCLASSECDQGFVCKDGYCTYRGYIDATYRGCSCGSPAGAWLGLLIPLLARMRGRRRRAGYLSNLTK